MYVLGDINDNVYEYSLSTAFDIGTESLTNTFDISGTTSNTGGLRFSDSGDKMFVSGFYGSKVFEYSLSTPFDTSTATFTDSLDTSNQADFVEGFAFSGSGDRTFVASTPSGESDSDTIIEYSNPADFDVNGATRNDSLDISTETSEAKDVIFNGDGTKMFVVDNANTRVLEYSVGSTTGDSKTGNGDIAIDFSNVSSAEDIAVYDQNGNLLDYEIESLDTANETATLWTYNSWVRDGSTQAQLAYGNNSANTDRQNAAATWANNSQNAELVYHLNESSGSAIDSTANSYDSSNTLGTTFDVSSEFNGGREFDGTDDRIEVENVIPDNTITPDTNDLTVVTWFSTTTASDPEGAGSILDIVSHSTGSAFLLDYNDDDSLRLINTGGDNLSGSTSLSDGNMHLVVLSSDVSQNTLELYADNSLEDSSTSYSYGSFTDNDFYLASFFNPGNKSFNNHLQGRIDALRIFTENKPDAWRRAEFDSSPSGGQVFFSQQAAESAGTTALATQATSYSYTTSTDSAVKGTGFGAQATTYSYAAQSTSVKKLTGTLTVEGAGTAGAAVDVYDTANNRFVERTTTDANGDWEVNASGGDYEIGYFFDDGTEFYADGETTDTR